MNQEAKPFGYYSRSYGIVGLSFFVLFLFSFPAAVPLVEKLLLCALCALGVIFFGFFLLLMLLEDLLKAIKKTRETTS